MKVKLISAWVWGLMVLGGFNVSVFAASAQVLEDGTVIIHHYEGQAAGNQFEAIDLLLSTLDETRDVIVGYELNNESLEAIHRISYSMENAVSSLQSNSASNHLLREPMRLLAQTVEEMHQASEGRDAALTVQSFVRAQVISEGIVKVLPHG